MKKSVAILCGGGPAPGINTVISSVAKAFLEKGYRVLGIHDGFRGLFSDMPEILDIDYYHADKIHSRGGSTLIMSRYWPYEEGFKTHIFTRNNVKLLVTIGGDNTAATAGRLSDFLKRENLDVSVIHVPKTIDNDLPLPPGMLSFGFHSARDEAVRTGNTLFEDARSTRSWIVLSSIGRAAGHLAFGIAVSCQFPMLVIPEMFHTTKPTLEIIVKLVVSSIIKRKIEGLDYGVAVVSESLFQFLDINDIRKAGIVPSYDADNRLNLGNISKAQVFNVLIQKELTKLKLDVKTRPVDLGYELRCARPVAYDLALCSLLGRGVKDLFFNGCSGCLVSISDKGALSPMPLKDLRRENNKILPRHVDINSPEAKVCFENLHFIAESDYELAWQYVDEPEIYDFNKLINL